MTEEPSLCIKGCGFFSTPQTKNLCSKCYNEFLKEESIRYLASLKIETETAVPEEVVVKKKKKTEKSISSRCNECRKKVGLLGFQCKCGHVFCGSHRYAEEHSCPWDYKTAAIRDLAIQNPIVKGDKLFRL